MPIRHATLHEHTQGLLQVPTLEQIISETSRHVFWAREGILRAIPRGITMARIMPLVPLLSRGRPVHNIAGA